MLGRPYQYFVDRPILTFAVALGVTITGILAALKMPIAQWPLIAPPSVTIGVNYPGASANTLERSTILPIAQNLYGLDGLEYVSTSANADGTGVITLTFAQGSDADRAVSQVISRLEVSRALLPSMASQQGIRVSKAAKSLSIASCIASYNDMIPEGELGDLMASQLQEPLTRLPGVGDYQPFFSEYSMRVWLRPADLAKYKLNVSDVLSAISVQNSETPLGQLSALPAAGPVRFSSSLSGLSRLSTAQEFRDIAIKGDPKGGIIRLGDVAKIGLGPASYQPNGTIDNHNVVCIGLKLAPGDNQVDLAKRVHNTMDRLKKNLPSSLRSFYPVDTSPFVLASLREVKTTLITSIALVIGVMYIFLGSWRATFIPSVTVPVVLFGTIGLLSLTHFTLNILTTLGLVLAIGLLVDDAIVVVEAVERQLSNGVMASRAATLRAMDEIGPALMGVVVVLSIVFVPLTFMGGAAGIVYVQFSATIVYAMVLSLISALTLTPTLCALLMKEGRKEVAKQGLRAISNSWGAFILDHYRRILSLSLRYRKMTGASYLFVSAIGLGTYLFLPSGFLPDEDQGLVFVQVNMKPGTPAGVTADVNRQITQYFSTVERASVSSVFTQVGFNFGGQSQSAAYAAINLKPFDERRLPSQSALRIVDRARIALKRIKGADIAVFLPPPVMDIGNATGFDFELENRSAIPRNRFEKLKNQLVESLSHDPRLTGVYANGLPPTPNEELQVDYGKALSLGVTPAEINDTLQTISASKDAGLFNRAGRVKHIYVEGDANDRGTATDFEKWYINRSDGQSVPINSFVGIKSSLVPQKAETYNGYQSFEILGQPALGYSTGEAMAVVENAVKNLGDEVGGEWTGMSFEQVAASSGGYRLYAIVAAAMFLALAGLYGNISAPNAVILSLPLGLLGCAVAAALRGLVDDMYFRVGVLTITGLAAKNSILIVEYALHHLRSGAAPAKAALLAASERFRPIVMTSLAFGIGTVGLAFSVGPSAASHIALGTAIVGGVCSGTVAVLIFIPSAFVWVCGISALAKEIGLWRKA